jgi:BlaI family transcriptional regulator, penicillinase repressor
MNDAAAIPISEAESQVMEVLWAAAAPMAAEQVIAALATSHQWQAATIKTLLNRLLNKGAIAARPEGRRFLYEPVLRREDWLARESAGLLERLFGGRITPLVAHFGSQRKLSRTDLQELRKLIDELDDGA